MLQSRSHVLAARARVALISRGGSNEGECAAMTEEQMRARASDERVVSVLDMWWRTACTWYDMKEGLSFEQYEQIATRVFKATSAGEYDADEARQATLMDWSLECGGDHAGRMPRDRFVALVFSLGEVWTPSPQSEAMTSFLYGLFECIAEPIPIAEPPSAADAPEADSTTPDPEVRQAFAAPTALARGATGHQWRPIEVSLVPSLLFALCPLLCPPQPVCFSFGWLSYWHMLS